MSKTITDLLTTWRNFAEIHDYPQPPPYFGLPIEIERIVEDSRLVTAGDCFVARVRPYSNGHPFIEQALAQGASLVIAQDGEAAPDDHARVWTVPDSALVETWLSAAWHDFPGQHLTVIGVTGTDGKTSVTNIVYEILVAAGFKTGMISTIKAIIGNREEPTGLHVSTPQAPETQAFLRKMVDDGCTHCVLESTSYGLAEYRADTAFFDVAIMTNITHEHLDYHGSWENYMQAKGRLFELAEQVAVINGDDVSADHLSQFEKPLQITYGMDNRRDLWASGVRFSAEKTTFTIEPLGIEIATPLVGKFNIYNILAAAAAAHSLEIENADIKRGIENVALISGRMERIAAGQKFLVIVDFAHTPNALRRAIEAARGMTRGKIITVFGSAGRRDVEKRRMMAEISEQYANLTVLTAEDPRQEPLEEILEMMAEGCRKHGGKEGSTFWRIPDRGRAIYHALTLASEHDLVLVCGKGHEQSMCFGTTEYDWDDRDATQAAIKAFLAKDEMVDLGLPTY